MKSQEQKLATEFCRTLRHWLTPEELAEAVRLNAAETDPGICHTHDFCDANQAMLDAFASVVGRSWRDAEPIGDNTEPAEWGLDDALIDAAWDIAKAARFNDAA